MKQMEVINIYKAFNKNVHLGLRCKEGLERDLLPIMHKVGSILILGYGSSSTILYMLKCYFPHIMNGFRRIVVTDPDQKIIERMEKENKVKFPHVTFERLNILEDKLKMSGTFDLIISIWGVVWVHDIEQTFTNVKSLLNDNGCAYFLIESINNFYFTVVRNLAKKHPWKTYLSEILQEIPNFVNPRKPSQEVKKIVTSLGLKSLELVHSDDIKCSYYFHNKKHLRDCVMGTYTAASLIPEGLLDRFFDAVEEEMIANGFTTRTPLNEENFFMPIQLLRTMVKKEVVQSRSPSTSPSRSLSTSASSSLSRSLSASPSASPTRSPLGSPSRLSPGPPSRPPSRSTSSSLSRSLSASPAGSPTRSPLGSPSRLSPRPPSRPPSRSTSSSLSRSLSASPAGSPTRSPLGSPSGLSSGPPSGSPSRAASPETQLL